MDIFDFALQMELDGEKYYRKLAEQVQYDDLKNILIGLADDEQSHYNIILAAKNKNFYHNDTTLSLSKIQNVFSINKEFFEKNEESITKLKYEQIDVYRGALAKEYESVELYKKLTETAATHEARLLCDKLMHEEEQHVAVLDHIIELLNHVNDWVESAEFNLKEEKY
jgi:rubrerythrin